MCAVCAGSVATGRDARTSRLCVCAFVISACVLVRWRLVVMRVLAALCVCAFVYQCMGGVL